MAWMYTAIEATQNTPNISYQSWSNQTGQNNYVKQTLWTSSIKWHLRIRVPVPPLDDCTPQLHIDITLAWKDQHNLWLFSYLRKGNASSILRSTERKRNNSMYLRLADKSLTRKSDLDTWESEDGLTIDVSPGSGKITYLRIDLWNGE